MIPTDDPPRDAIRYEARRRADGRPRCSGCGRVIQTEGAFLAEQKYYCWECQSLAWNAVKFDYLVNL